MSSKEYRSLEDEVVFATCEEIYISLRVYYSTTRNKQEQAKRKPGSGKSDLKRVKWPYYIWLTFLDNIKITTNHPKPSRDEPTQKQLWTHRSNHRRCSVEKVFLEISQNSHENTCARVSVFIKLQAYFYTPWKRQKTKGEFCKISKNTFLYRAPPVAASEPAMKITPSIRGREIQFLIPKFLLQVRKGRTFFYVSVFRFFFT